MLNLFVLTLVITGYCNASCDKPAYHPAYGITASGTRTHQGTMACPPQWAFGTRAYIPGVGWFICEDRGSAIKWNGEKYRVDLWFSDCDEALEWGVQEKRVVVVEELFRWKRSNQTDAR